MYSDTFYDDHCRIYINIFPFGCGLSPIAILVDLS